MASQVIGNSIVFQPTVRAQSKNIKTLQTLNASNAGPVYTPTFSYSKHFRFSIINQAASISDVISKHNGEFSRIISFVPKKAPFIDEFIFRCQVALNLITVLISEKTPAVV